jgi:PhnB protein
MNPTLLFDFSVNKEKKTINVKREFAADLPTVWAAWTTPELLDLWWAPRPYQTQTKSMDFREGGNWFYCMIAPDGAKHWCRVDYTKIEALKKFSALDAFCDENRNINPDLPRSQWNNSFSGAGDSTTVNIIIEYKQLEDLEKIIQMGFKEGFAMALGNLDQYLQAQFKLRTELQRGKATRVSTYLNFPGKTEEAFMFYRSIFKSEFAGNGIQRFGDIPQDSNQPPIAESVKKMVLHVELPILGNHLLMGTDAAREMGFTVTPGNNMHISLEPEKRDETKRIFDALSAGGTITMPLQDMFWGAYYGACTDKYGINWMVNCLEPNSAN